MTESYNRRAQLETWHRIVNKRHDPDEPVSDYLYFIQERVEELEGQGVTWTKDSMLGLLFQAGLPSSYPYSFDHTNDILDDHAKSSGSPLITASVVLTAIEAEETRMKSSSLRLIGLPENVLLQIIDEVYLAGAPNPHERPGLADVRRLATVNRHLSKLCYPYLWKVCPTQLSSSKGD